MSETDTGNAATRHIARAASALRVLVPQRFRRDRPVVPVLRLSGAIGISAPLRPGLSMAGIARSLEKLFAVRNAAAVALVINSPGGSPVQSHLIFRRIRDLATENNRKVIAFVEDAAASGGYMIACAADEIIADPNSVVGSIGVVGGTFGFDKLIAKIGVERRLYTSGEHKAMLDPFLPEDPGDVERLKSLQREIHEGFIALVKSRRGGKLNGPEETPVLRRILDRRQGAGFRVGRCDRRYPLGAARALRQEGAHAGDPAGARVPRPPDAWGSAPKPCWGPGLRAVSSGLAEDMIAALEVRALWARYGL